MDTCEYGCGGGYCLCPAKQWTYLLSIVTSNNIKRAMCAKEKLVAFKMKLWLLSTVASIGLVLVLAKKDTRVSTLSDTGMHLQDHELQCWNTYFTSKCFRDYLSNHPERSFRNHLYGADLSTIDDDGADDVNKLDSDSSGIISSDIQDIQLSDKRSVSTVNSDCDCQMKNDYKDLGQMHFPRYIITALCQDEKQKKFQSRKFWRGSQCKPVEYIVHVLTPRLATDSHDDTLVPDSLRPLWKFDKVTVTAGCFCSF